LNFQIRKKILGIITSWREHFNIRKRIFKYFFRKNILIEGKRYKSFVALNLQIKKKLILGIVLCRNILNVAKKIFKFFIFPGKILINGETFKIHYLCSVNFSYQKKIKFGNIYFLAGTFKKN
jgi:hypothetical protein